MNTHTNSVIRLSAVTLVLLVLGTMMLNVPSAMADQPPGKLAFKFNIIGVPRGTAAPGAEDGNGRRIFIPLKTDYYTDPCQTIGGQNNPDTSMVPTKGVKISVSAGAFDIVDGDAVVDKKAAFTMPAAHYDVYLVAKGKPGGCLDLEAYTNTTISGVETLIFVGSIDVDRTTGKPQWQNVNFLLYGSGGEIWFADPYYDYFWQLYNNGLRNMEVRFYEIPV